MENKKETKIETIQDKLIYIQQNLNVGKDQYNKFGKFSYRTVSDIMIATKPLLDEVACALLLSDELIQLENRYYIKATATLIDAKTKDTIYTTAYARETETRSGMDAAQITGSASTYARKYALNGLLAIDDTVDPDSKKADDIVKIDKSTGEVKVDTTSATKKLIKLVKEEEK